MFIKNNIIYLLFVFTLNFVTASANTIMIVDDETNSPVPYVWIQAGKHIFSADIDGRLILNIDKNLTYSFSRMGYEKIEIEGDDLIDRRVVRMKMLPEELNPIIITAENAFSLLEKYISNTSKEIKNFPFYMNRYESNKIFKGDSLILDAKGILASKISKKGKPGKGVSSTTRLKGMSLITADELNANELRKLPYYPLAINQFLVLFRSKSLYFYISDSNDSVSIIGYKPNKGYTLEKKRVLLSGKFHIDKATETIICIESEIEPLLLKQIQEVQQSDDKRDVIFDYVYRTIRLENGLPVFVEEKEYYRSKKDKLESVYTNIVVQKYELTDKDSFDSKPYKRAKRTAIAYQTPFVTASFEEDFNKGYFK